MTKTNELEIYKTAYVLTREMHRIRIKMPKALKYDIGQEMMQSGLSVIRGIILASRAGEEKVKSIRDFLTEVEVLWTYLRLAYDFGAMSQGEFRLLSERLNDLTKQGASWMKWSKGQNSDSVQKDSTKIRTNPQSRPFLKPPQGFTPQPK